MSSISDALSTLSDRGLRRLLGARTFLRGLDYAKRGVVENVHVNTEAATGEVRGSDPEPYKVTITLGGEGIAAECTCPAYVKTQQHCKHVASLLITVRNQARAKAPRPAQPATPATPAAAPVDGGSKSSRRRERRRRSQQQQQMAVPPGLTVPSPDAAARATGIGAWLAPEGSVRRLALEFRVHVRQGGLTVTVLDVEARVPLLPSVALAWQAVAPTPDRAALRILSRFESGNPRHPAVDIRGEDVADLLPRLKSRTVLLEPALMQLRFTDEPLQPRFDLEMVGHDTIIAKATFDRGDGRRFALSSGGWFEGSPGWHIDVTEGIARPIDARVSPAALRRLLRSPTIAEPASDLIALIMNGLPRVALEVGAPLPDLSQVADVVDLHPEFRMTARGNLLEARVNLSAAYGDVDVEVRPDGISPPVIIQSPGEGQKRAKCVRTDIVAQQRAAQLLLDLGLSPDEEGNGFVAHGEAAMSFWGEGVGTLPEEWTLYVPDELLGAHIRSSPVQMKARVSSGVDWLSVNVSYESEGVLIDRKELERCLAEGKKFVRLNDNSFAPIDLGRMQALVDREVELLHASGKNGRLPLSQAGRVRELLEQADSSTVATSAKKLFEKLGNIDGIKKAKKPRSLKATLRPYQEQGLSWLMFVHEIGSGGVLADDMGLGKTIQTIAMLLTVKQEQKGLHALIVAPTSVVGNWVRELQRFGPSLSVALWHGAGRKGQLEDLDKANIVITSYALLRRDIELLNKLDLDYAILDEAQNIKNPESATAQAARDIQSRRRLALTGTPIENRLSEIWSIFEFVSPGLLGPLKRFEEKFARPIDQGDSKTAARLRAVIHPFILRRTKMEVASDLPPKIEVDKLIDMPTDQRAIYLQVLREVRAQVMGEVERVGIGKSHLHILAGLTKLRQAACDPRLLGLPREFTHDDSGKLAALRELVDEAESGGHKVLIFSQFVSMLKLVKEALVEDKIKFEYLDGATKDRQAPIERFQTDPTVTAFLISLKAGGSGLNLTAADTVIHFDPWWNPAVEDQASDRAHRIGQKKVVTVYRLVAADTIEDKILQLKEKKRELVASVLSEDAGGSKRLSETDLDELFRMDD